MSFVSKIKQDCRDEIINLCFLFYFVQYQEGQRRRKPYYSSVDLSEVEWEDKDDIVRAKPYYKRSKVDFFLTKRNSD